MPLDNSSPDVLPRKALQLRNAPDRWGVVAAVLHWAGALAVLGLFVLGLWMTSLSYYDPWYKTGPDIHRAIGIVLFIAILGRIAWRALDRAPAPVPTHQRWEIASAHIIHGLLYLLLLIVMISGYLISTADGRAIDVFGWFAVPATVTAIPKQEDVAGAVHFWLAVALIGLAGTHALAAVKHHVIDKDPTLVRMFVRAKR